MSLRRAALVVVLVLAFPPAAWAVEEFQGQTEQGKPVVLLVSDQRVVRSGYIQWRTRDCDQDGFRFTARTWIGPANLRPFDESTPERFAGRFAYIDDGGPGRSRISVVVEGARASERLWVGTFSARVVVTRHGDVFTRCRLPEIHWEANY